MGMVVETKRYVAFDGRICVSQEEMDAYEASILYDEILAEFGDDVLGAGPPSGMPEAQKAAWGAQRTRTLRDAGLFIAWAAEHGLFVEGAVPSLDDPSVQDRQAVERAVETLKTGVVRRRNKRAAV